MTKINIGKRMMGDGEPCFIIAEAGVNHNGKLELAKKLVDAAVEAGADAVKFQLLTARGLYVKDAGKFKNDFGEEMDIYDIWKKTEVPDSWIPELFDYCKEKDIIFLSSVFEEKGVDILERYVDAYKIASYELTHIPLLMKAAKTGKTIIFSIGGADIEEIKEVIAVVKGEGNKNIVIMQCVAKYPMPLDIANVNAIETLKKEFPDIVVGYSDHSLDPISVPVAAVVKGAKVIEKHFTLSRDMQGIDHKMSVEPEELKKMVSKIKEAEEKIKDNKAVEINERVLGDGSVRLTEDQEELMKFTRRKIFAVKDVNKGEDFTKENIAVLRPGNKESEEGIHPREFERIIGLKAGKHILQFDLIKEEDVKK